MKKEDVDKLRRKEDITVDEVRGLPTFKDWDDEKIKELLRIIKTFTEIAYQIHTDRKDGRIVALHIDNQPTKAA